MSENLEEQLLEMEHAFWQASTDPDFYRKHVAEDVVLVFPYGVGAMDKKMVLYTIGANTEEWENYEISEVGAVSLAEDAALITYKVSAERAVGDEPFEAFVSSVYIRSDGPWLLAFHQQTLASTGV